MPRPVAGSFRRRSSPRCGRSDARGRGRRWRRAGSARRGLIWRSTRPVSEWLVARLDPAAGAGRARPGRRGRRDGVPGGAALGAGGRLITSDREPGMVEAARRAAAELGVTNAEFRVLDMDADRPAGRERRRRSQPVRLHPPRRPAAGARARSGACFGPAAAAFAVWAARDRNPWMTVPADVMVSAAISSRQTRPSGASPRAATRVDRARSWRPPASPSPRSRRWRCPTGSPTPTSSGSSSASSAARSRSPSRAARGGAGRDPRARSRARPRVVDGFELGGISLNVESRSYDQSSGALAEWLGSGLQSR